MWTPGGVHLYFFKQKGSRPPPKRFRKLPEELPQGLRYAHLSPKVAAFLANKEKQQQRDDVDGLSKTSLLPEITQSFHNVRGNIDSLLENDEDSQRYLYEEARMTAPSILQQLAKFIYTFEDIRKVVPGSLEYLLMMGWKEMTADVVPIPREWQTSGMREMVMANQSSDELLARSEDAVIERKNSDLEGVKPVKSSEKHTALVGEQGKVKKKGSKTEEEEVSADKRLEKLRVAATGPRPKPRHTRIKTICRDSGSGSIASGSPGSISSLGENSPADHKHFHSTYASSLIQFQLSSQACEEKGWIIPHRSQQQLSDDLQGQALDIAVHMLQLALKKQKEQVLEVDTGFQHPIMVKYYGVPDTASHPGAQPSLQHNPIYRGQKPRIPSLNPGKGKQLVKACTTDGTTTVLYPSGRLAVVSSQAGFGRPGYYTIVYDDLPDARMLACFTPAGKGVCLHSNGFVRLVLNKRGGQTYDDTGTLLTKWRWPMGGMKLTSPVVFQVCPSVSLRCLSRSNVVLVFSCQKEAARFVVGPVAGAVEPKAGDEDQLLTSLSFSSRSATDLNKIPELKKSTSSTKARKKKERAKAYVAEVQRLLSDHGPDELEVERDLERLKQKARLLVDDWMEHYRIHIGLSIVSLKTMKDEPSVRKRDVQSAKAQAGATPPSASKAEVEIAAPDPKIKLRAPSAPAFSEVRERLLSRAQTARSSRPATAVRISDETGGDSLADPLTPGPAHRGPLHSAPGMRPRPHSLAGSKSVRSAVSHSQPASHSAGVLSTVGQSAGFCPVALRAEMMGYERPLCRCSRHHIPFIADVEYDEFLRTEVPRNQMVIISVVSTLYPDSTRGEVMIEKIHIHQNRNRTRPCMSARHDPFRILRYDIASAAYESDHTQPMLLARHNVVPGMFLIYQNGNLVFCDHIFNGYGNAKKDFRKQIMRCRADAIHGRFLPKDFHFSPGHGRVGRRAAWGGQIGGAGVDHYGNPGMYLSPITPVSLRPESASTSNTEENLQKVYHANLRGLQPTVALQTGSCLKEGSARADPAIPALLSPRSIGMSGSSARGDSAARALLSSHSIGVSGTA